MIQSLTDLFLAMETVEKCGIALDLGMGDFDGHLPAVSQVSTAKYGGHATAGHQAVNAVMIELLARMERGHRNRSGKGQETGPTTVSNRETSPSCQKICKEFIKNGL